MSGRRSADAQGALRAGRRAALSARPKAHAKWRLRSGAPPSRARYVRWIAIGTPSAPFVTSAIIVGQIPPEGARFLLGLGIGEAYRKRMLELLAKQQQGEITPAEREDLESYVDADNILSILKAQALLALKRAGQEP